MVRNRTKSRRDIIQQLIRIENNADDARADKAAAIAKRYINNIRNTRSYQRTLAKGEKALIEKGNEAGMDIMRSARDVQYSRNTYMGLNGG